MTAFLSFLSYLAAWAGQPATGHPLLVDPQDALYEQRVRAIRFPERPDVTLPAESHAALPELITMLAARVHVFMVGPSGSGKSSLARQAADALGLALYALSLGPTTPTSKLFGFRSAGGEYVRTPFREAYEHGGVMLIDELDNGHPGVVAELNQALANDHGAFADGMVDAHDDFRLVATGNTYGLGPDRRFVGRNQLDAATLDRFALLQVPIDGRLEERLTMAAAAGASRRAKREAKVWLEEVRRTRERVTTAGINVVISPRAAIEGARLLAAGMDYEAVREARLLGNLDAATRAKVAS
jgi:cobaltochelatase CobS